MYIAIAIEGRVYTHTVICISHRPSGLLGGVLGVMLVVNRVSLMLLYLYTCGMCEDEGAKVYLYF